MPFRIRGRTFHFRVRQLKSPDGVVIWHNFGSETLQRVLSPAFMPTGSQLPVWGSSITITPGLLFHSLINFICGSVPKVAVFDAWLRDVGARVVVTFNDNSNIHDLANSLPRIRFIAIQNGWRFPQTQDAALPLEPNSYFASTLITLGQNDIDGYTRGNTHFRRIIPAGSLTASIARDHVAPGLTNSREHFDLCFISSFRITPGASLHLPGYSQLRADYAVALASFFTLCRQSPELRIGIALNSSIENRDALDEEITFFQTHVGRECHLEPRNNELRSSYAMICKSRVNMTSSSTLGLEALGLRRRIVLNATSLRHQLEGSELPSWLACGNTQHDVIAGVHFALSAPDFEFWDDRSQSAADYLIESCKEVDTKQVIVSEIRNSLEPH